MDITDQASRVLVNVVFLNPIVILKLTETPSLLQNIIAWTSVRNKCVSLGIQSSSHASMPGNNDHSVEHEQRLFVIWARVSK